MITKVVSAVAIALVLAGLACVSLQAQDIWSENYEDSRSKAEREGKDLLLEFTGSDWCPYCVKMRHEVFEQADFRSDVPKQFVLVELDFPQAKRQKDSVRAQNEALQEKYGIDGFPTVLLTDPKGVPYAKVGYNANSSGITPHLVELRKRKIARDELMSKAKLATGIERAKLLDQVIADKDPDEFIAGFDDILDQIVAADSDNKAGLKAKYETRVELRPIIRIAEEGNVDGAVGKLDQMLREHGASSTRKQEVLYMKAILLQFKSDATGSIAALKAAHDLDPTSVRGKEIGGILKNLQEN
jgi:thioredoxin-related protein